LVERPTPAVFETHRRVPFDAASSAMVAVKKNVPASPQVVSGVCGRNPHNQSYGRHLSV